MSESTNKRILIFGGAGMLGHKLAQLLSPLAEVTVTLHNSELSDWPLGIPVTSVIGQVDVREISRVVQVLDTCRPDIVLNAVGVIKQIVKSHDPADTVAVNALYPTRLSQLCEARGIRLIHFSTDCVYSGSSSGERGPNGYRECDLPDPRDLYGMSKLLGEPTGSTGLILRTSIIGRELRRGNSLVEWFLAQGTAPVKGFTRALFTGLTTIELARVTIMLLFKHEHLTGLWHVAAEAIDKCALLRLIGAGYGKRIEVEATEDFYCDRRLDGKRFNEQTGWQAPSWFEMIDMMCDDPFDYETLATSEESKHHA